MTLNKALHPRDDVDRQYVSRTRGGRGFSSIQHQVNASIQWLDDCIKKRGGGLITATRNNTDNTSIIGAKITRKQKWEENKLYEHFKLETSEITQEKTWTWQRKVKLNRETESLFMAAQSKAIRSKYVKARIDKTQQNCRCWLCGDRDETINHIISECSKLAQKECKTRHDWMGKVIHWELCKKFKFDHTNKWYIHNPWSVLENETRKILLGFVIQTDHLISAKQPDLAIVNNKKREPAEKWTLLFQQTKG